MRGMILAAGLGSRLGSITEHTPKCLVEAGGCTMLEHTIHRMVRAGASELMVNLHHLAPIVERFLDTHPIAGARISRSFESTILETGGGVKAVAAFFRSTQAHEPGEFLVHNADVYTTVDLKILREAQNASSAGAVLLVGEQPGKRGLLVNQKNQLCGWVGKDGRTVVCESPDLRLVNFCGIQLCSPAVLDWMEPLGAHFSIIEAYLEGVKRGATVTVLSVPPEDRWFDVGTPERLEALRSFLA